MQNLMAKERPRKVQGHGAVIGRRINGLRTGAGVTLQDLSNRAGVSISVLSKLESGKIADPRISTVFALARALGVAGEELVREAET